MSSLLVFNRVYRLEVQSVMLVFSTLLCEQLSLQVPLTFSLVYLDSFIGNFFQAEEHLLVACRIYISRCFT